MKKNYNVKVAYKFLVLIVYVQVMLVLSSLVMLLGFCSCIVVVVFVLLSVAYLTVVERKIMSSVQRRIGLEVVGVYGLFQAVSDGLKLMSKEWVWIKEGKGVFMMGLIWTFVLSILMWLWVLIGGEVLIENELSGLIVVILSSLGVYGVLLGGWSSSNKYAVLGGMRSCGQMIFYELVLGLSVWLVWVVNGSISLTGLLIEGVSIKGKVLGLAVIVVICMISVIAETNRHLFDLLEAESELVSGYNVEYSSVGFVLYFLGEYSNIIIMSSLMVCWFCSGKKIVLEGMKIWLVLLVFIMSRSCLLRYRYDQLMLINWKGLLMIVFGYVVLVSSILIVCY